MSQQETEICDRQLARECQAVPVK